MTPLDDARLRALRPHDLPAPAAQAQWQHLERSLAYERELSARPPWQRWTARAYGQVIEPLLLLLVSGYYLVWALLHAGPWLH